MNGNSEATSGGGGHISVENKSLLNLLDDQEPESVHSETEEPDGQCFSSSSHPHVSNDHILQGRVSLSFELLVL